MKTPRIAAAIGHIDNDLIATAAKDKKRSTFHPWLKWGSIAAGLAILIIAGTIILPSLLGRESDHGESDGRYKDVSIQAGESAIVWPWEYLSAGEKFKETELDGIKYISRGSEVSAVLVGELIGTYTATGYDGITDNKYTMEAEVYRLQDVTEDRLVAVKLEDTFYVFRSGDDNPPNTLGELFDEVNLPKIVNLERFTETGNDSAEKFFALNNDDGVWEILSECRDAALADSEQWSLIDKEYLGFTLTSEALGIYKKAMLITTDGYLWTNAFDHLYLYDIGEVSAEKIIKYATDNSSEAPYEPFRNWIAGKVTGITEDYIFVDDSILCKNPDEGITYRIPLDDIRVSRYVDLQIIKKGDLVHVTYEGGIDAENGYAIDRVISISEAIISGKDILIPE